MFTFCSSTSLFFVTDLPETIYVHICLSVCPLPTHTTLSSCSSHQVLVFLELLKWVECLPMPMWRCVCLCAWTKNVVLCEFLCDVCVCVSVRKHRERTGEILIWGVTVEVLFQVSCCKSIRINDCDHKKGTNKLPFASKIPCVSLCHYSSNHWFWL